MVNIAILLLSACFGPIWLLYAITILFWGILLEFVMVANVIACLVLVKRFFPLSFLEV